MLLLRGSCLKRKIWRFRLYQDIRLHVFWYVRTACASLHNLITWYAPRPPDLTFQTGMYCALGKPWPVRVRVRVRVLCVLVRTRCTLGEGEGEHEPLASCS